MRVSARDTIAVIENELDEIANRRFKEEAPKPSREEHEAMTEELDRIDRTSQRVKAIEDIAKYSKAFAALMERASGNTGATQKAKAYIQAGLEQNYNLNEMIAFINADGADDKTRNAIELNLKLLWDYTRKAIKETEAYRAERLIFMAFSPYYFKGNFPAGIAADLADISEEEFQTFLKGEKFKQLLRQILEKFKADVLGIEPEESVENLPALRAIMPAYHNSPNTKLANKLADLIGIGEANIAVRNEGKASEITNYVNVTYSLDSIPNFTEFDRQVYDGICTIWSFGDGSHLFTPTMVFRAMTHSKTGNPSPQQKGAIAKSIAKMRGIFVDVDATAEAQAHARQRGLKDAEQISYKKNAALLALTGHDLRNGKQRIKGFSIDKEPILLEHARMTGRILTSSGDMLDVKQVEAGGHIGSSLQNTSDHIVIKGYLWRRVLEMGYDENKAADALRKYEARRSKKSGLPAKKISEFRNTSRTILFDTMFSVTGLDGKSRDKKLDCRKYAFQCLDYWKATGTISGYKKQTKGKAVTGMQIEFKTEAK